MLFEDAVVESIGDLDKCAMVPLLLFPVREDDADVGDDTWQVEQVGSLSYSCLFVGLEVGIGDRGDTARTSCRSSAVSKPGVRDREISYFKSIMLAFYFDDMRERSLNCVRAKKGEEKRMLTLLLRPPFGPIPIVISLNIPLTLVRKLSAVLKPLILLLVENKLAVGLFGLPLSLLSSGDELMIAKSGDTTELRTIFEVRDNEATSVRILSGATLIPCTDTPNSVIASVLILGKLVEC